MPNRCYFSIPILFSCSLSAGNLMSTVFLSHTVITDSNNNEFSSLRHLLLVIDFVNNLL